MGIALANKYTASGSGTTVDVTATNGVSAGDLLTVIARTQLPVYIVSISAGGTIVDPGVRASAAGNRGNVVGGYVLSASSVTAGGTITVTFSGDTGGAKISIRNWTVTGGTAAFDGATDLSANDLSGDPANKVTGPSALTLTSSSAIVLMAASAFDSGGSSIDITAVDGAWTDTDFLTAGFADQVGISSFSAPNWSATGATIKATLAMAFGFNPTPVSYVAMVDFRGGTAGAAPTVATIEASTFGAASITNPIITGTTPRYWVVTNPSTYLTYNAFAHHALNGPGHRFAIGGATYADAGSLGLQLDTTGGGVVRSLLMYVPWSGNPGQGVGPVAMATCFFRTSLGGADSVNMDVFGIYGTESGGSNYTNVILHATGGNLRLELEGSVDTPVVITDNVWYQIAILWERNALGKLMVFDVDGKTQIGTTQTITQHATAYPWAIYLGDANGAAVTSARVVWWDKVRMYFLGTQPTFPLLDIVPTPPTPVLKDYTTIGDMIQVGVRLGSRRQAIKILGMR
jgi:hypothetical protein